MVSLKHQAQQPLDQAQVAVSQGIDNHAGDTGKNKSNQNIEAVAVHDLVKLPGLLGRQKLAQNTGTI